MRKLVFLAFFAILWMVSCREPYDIELGDQLSNRLVVDGMITTEPKEHLVKLSRTSLYLSNTEAPVEQAAKVKILELDTFGNLLNTFDLTEKEPGNYYTAMVQGKEKLFYELQIETTDGEKYQAKSYLRPAVSIDSVTYDFDETLNFQTNETDSFYVFYFFGPEPKGKGDAYYWELYSNDTLLTDSLRELNFVDDEAVDGKYIYDFALFTIDAKHFQQDISKAKIVMHTIERPVYDYFLNTMFETEWKSGIFDGPPANVLGNVSNNGVGYFYASDIENSYVEVVKGVSRYRPEYLRK